MNAAAVCFCFALAMVSAESAFVGGFSDSRIANGYTASPGQFPYQALLKGYTASGSSYLCGGSVLSPWWIITAAHCCAGVVKFEIDLGAHNFVNNGEPHRVQFTSSQIHVHAPYNPSALTNDVAVIKVSKQIAFNTWIQPVTLPPANSNFVGALAVASGWGLQSSSGSSPAPVLQFGVFKVISNQVCSLTFGSIIDAGKICAQGVDLESICFGDSGGPLVLKNTKMLIGISSFVSSNSLCSSTSPNGFARVSNYLSWIQQKTGVVF